MRYFLISAVFLISAMACAQEKSNDDPDTVFKSFAAAYFMHDLKKMQSLTVYTESLKTLLEMPRLDKVKLEEISKELKTQPIKWYQKGEKVKIHGGHITVNELMSNESKQIGNIKILDFVYPLQLKKLRTGQWKVDPTFMIQSVRKQVDTESKRKRKNFRVELDGSLYYLNEGEMINFKDASGKERIIKLFKNDIQHYKDGRISFQYHKEMDVFPGPSKNGFVYTLNSDLGPEVHVLLFKEGADLKEERDKFIKLWIENYEVKDARFEKVRLKNVSQSINGEENDGKVMYVILNGNVLYNQFNFLKIDGRVVGVFGKSKSVDAGLLNQYLAIVCENIRPAKRKGRK